MLPLALKDEWCYTSLKWLSKWKLVNFQTRMLPICFWSFLSRVEMKVNVALFLSYSIRKMQRRFGSASKLVNYKRIDQSGWFVKILSYLTSNKIFLIEKMSAPTEIKLLMRLHMWTCQWRPHEHGKILIPTNISFSNHEDQFHLN